jgi:TFIIH basal transcription factor complex TTD-A subunit
MVVHGSNGGWAQQEHSIGVYEDEDKTLPHVQKTSLIHEDEMTSGHPSLVQEKRPHRCRLRPWLIVSTGGLGTAIRNRRVAKPFVIASRHNLRYPDGQPYLTTAYPRHTIISPWSKLFEVCCAHPHFFLAGLELTFMTGSLVKCDASIKAMLVDIDSKNNNEYIIQELDEEHILVKETKINELKARLNEV